MITIQESAWLAFRQQLWERDGGICGLCHVPVELNPQMHIDHIVPRSRGGTHDLTNLQITHRTCNMKKSDGRELKHLVTVGRPVGTPPRQLTTGPVEGLTVREVAQRLKVSEKTVRRWLQSSRMQAIGKVSNRGGWRIPSSEVERLLRDSR